MSERAKRLTYWVYELSEQNVNMHTYLSQLELVANDRTATSMRTVPRDMVMRWMFAFRFRIDFNRVWRTYNNTGHAHSTYDEHVWLYDLISLQSPRNTRSSSVVTLARPPTRSSLKITSRSFRYASPYLWNQLPHSLRQARLDLPLPDSSLLHDHLTSPVSSSPLLSSITPSFFHSKLKTFLFLKSYQGSIDIWHLFGLISRIPGLFTALFSVSVFF